MTPWLHMGAFVVMSVCTCLWVAGRAVTPDGPKIVAAISLSPALSLGAGLLASHECSMGQPIQQWLLPGLCMSAVLLWTPQSLQKAICLILLFGSAIGLSKHYADIVHGREWQGLERAVSKEYGAIQGQSEWHTPLTGLYRKSALGHEEN